ncbi:MAG: hypothetical protein AB9872_15835 [Solidesulfovibrio sp.]
MTNCLKIVVTYRDSDLLEIEIFASSARFAGSTSVYVGLDQLTEFAELIAGFPISPEDQRRYIFGTKDKGFAGGYCVLRFFCLDRTGHAAMEVEFEDDAGQYSEASAKFTIPVLPYDIDEFVRELRLSQNTQFQEARLESKS